MNRPAAHRLKFDAAGASKETLYEYVNRAKHRWLKRAMYDSAPSSSEKCFAYLVMDRLNCVTLDCWPSQKLIADQFGWSIKTVHRVAVALEKRGYLGITRNTHASYRYAPIFLPEDECKSGGALRRACPPGPDKNVGESSLGILPNLSSPSAGRFEFGKGPKIAAASKYDEKRRGFYEVELAKRLGSGGSAILERLGEHSDAAVERLCRALADDELNERELEAARLAALQMPRKRGAN